MGQKFSEIKKMCAEAAVAAGVKEYELYYTASDSAEIEMQGESVKHLDSSQRSGLCLRVLENGRCGYASTQLFEQEHLEELFIRAKENAAYGLEEPEGHFYTPKAGLSTVERAQEWSSSLPEMIRNGQQLQKEMKSSDRRITDGIRSSLGEESGSRAIFNTNGLDVQEYYHYGITLAMSVMEEEGKMDDDFAYCLGNFADIDMKKLAAEAVEKCGAKMSSGEVVSGKYPVIIEGETFGALLQAYFEIFSGEAAQKGMTLLAGKEGQQIASEIVTITDDPLSGHSVMPCSFDSEGVPSRKKHVVEHGRLQTLLHNRGTAWKAGTANTGNAGRAGYASNISVQPYTFYLEPGGKTGEELFAEAGQGIYVTGVTGLHAGANSVTGDFSIQSEGFLIENGRKARAVKNFTIAGNFFDLLKNITDLGDTLKLGMPRGRTRFGSPDVRVQELSVAGKD